MSVETLLQTLLVQIVTDESNTSAQDKKTIQRPSGYVLIRLIPEKYFIFY
jgi:hypothetical protein